MLDLQGDTLKKMVGVQPPPEVRLVRESLGDHNGLIFEIPLAAKFELKQPHTKQGCGVGGLWTESESESYEY